MQLLRQATVAESKPAELPDGLNGPEAAFDRGKIATVRFFAQEVLPLLTAERSVAERTNTALMTVPDEAWWPRAPAGGHLHRPPLTRVDPC